MVSAILGVTALIAVLAIWFISAHREAPVTAHVRGSLTLQGGGGYTTDTPCYGNSNSLVDFSDIRGGTRVNILDASNKIVGSGELQPGISVPIPSSTLCRFDFDIPLDSTSSHYQFALGSRPPYTFDDPSNLVLTLGR